MLVFGDSIMWGQGLKEEYKFHSIVENHIKSNLAGVQVNKKVMAHSGAIIGKDVSDPIFRWNKVPGEDGDKLRTFMKRLDWRFAWDNWRESEIHKNGQVITVGPVSNGEAVAARAAYKIADIRLTGSASATIEIFPSDEHGNRLRSPFIRPVVYSFIVENVNGEPSIVYGNLHGEINTSFPTILQQVRYYKGPPYPNDVNLILVDGCINDVGAFKITNPRVSSNDIIHQANLSCYHGMKQLLTEITNKFPNAKVIVAGYYQEISDNSYSKLRELINWIIPYYLTIVLSTFPGGPAVIGAYFVEHNVLTTIIRNWRTFASDSTYFLKLAVDEINGPSGCIGCPFSGERISLAIPDFRPENAILAERPYVFEFYRKENIGNLGLPLLYYFRENKLPVGVLDEVKEERAHACNNPGIFSVPNSFDSITCPVASIGHPNFDGAKEYARAITAVLPPLEDFIYPPRDIKATFLNVKLTDNIGGSIINSKILFAAGSQNRAYPESYTAISITPGQPINLPDGFEIISTLKGHQEFIGAHLSQVGLYRMRLPPALPGVFEPHGDPLTITVGKTFNTKNNIISNTYTDTAVIIGFDRRNIPHQLSAEVTYRITATNTGSNVEPVNPVQLMGTSQNDLLRGTNDSDTMRGLEGDDQVYGFDGNDTAFGDLGLDYIYGGNGSDKIFGSDGNDFLYGEMGHDDINGETGDDKLYGSAGNDIIIGGQGQDELNGEDGDDIIRSFDGNADTIQCGTGMDTVDGYDSPRDTISEDCEIIRGGLD
jgi:hypothetical protein